MLPGENGRPSPFMEIPKMASMNRPPSSKTRWARSTLRAFPAAWSPIEVAGWRNLKPADFFAPKRLIEMEPPFDLAGETRQNSQG